MAQWWKENTVYVLSHQDATVCSVPARLLAYCMSESPVNAVCAPQRPKLDHYFLTDTLHRHEYVTVADAWLVKAVYSSHTLATYIVLTIFFLFFSHFSSSNMKCLRTKSWRETVEGQNGANENSFLCRHHIMWKKHTYNETTQEDLSSFLTKNTVSNQRSSYTHWHRSTACVCTRACIASLDLHSLRFDTVFSYTHSKGILGSSCHCIFSCSLNSQDVIPTVFSLQEIIYSL